MRILIILKLFLMVVGFANISFAKLENNIVVKVENQVITNFEIKNKILTTLFLSNQEVNQNNINNLKKQSLNNLVQHKLRKIELSKYNFEADRNQYNNYLNSISSNNIDSLKLKFKENNLDFDLFKDEIETQLKWQKLIYQIYSKKIRIDREMVDKELNLIVDNSLDFKEFRLSEIEIFSNNDKSDLDKINEIKKQIEINGFEKTAINFSISGTSSTKGDLGWISSKSLSKNIFDIVNKLKIGENTDAIKKQESILFLKLVDKRISKINDINKESLKKRIIDSKKNELFNLYSNSHLSKLKNNSLIEYK